MKKFVLKKGIPMIPVLPFFILAMMYMILPMLTIVTKSFIAPDVGGFSLENFTTIFSKAIYKKSIENSLKLSVTSAFVGLGIAFIAGMCLEKVSRRMRTGVMAVMSMTSNFAGLPLAFVFMLVLGNTGVFKSILQAVGLNWLDGFNLYSYNGVLVLFIYFQIPLGTMLLMPSFEAIQKEWKEASTLMRSSGLRFWLEVGIPNLLPGLCGTYGMLFANALTAYATVYMIMTSNFPLLPTKIAVLFTADLVAKEELGSALSLVMVMIMLIVIALTNLCVKLFYKGGEGK